MKTMTVELYSNSGEKVNEFKNIDRITVFDTHIRIHYEENGEIHVVESNLPFIYYDGVEEEK